MEDNGFERSFMDIITGGLGLLAVFIVIIAIYALTNAKIGLQIKANRIDDKYPLFIICEKNQAVVVCDESYLPSDALRASLQRMCGFLESMKSSTASAGESWNVIEKFLSSSQFDKRQFYVFAIIRPSGLKAFYRVASILRAEGLGQSVTPIPESWGFNVAIER